jgi:hypothetical protein
MSFAGVPVRELAPSGPNIMTAIHGTDRGLFVEFSLEAEPQPFESEKAGRHVFKDVPYIHIMTPGGKSDVRRRAKLERSETDPVPTDPERFPQQWQAFQNKREQVQHGTPLEMWAPMAKSLVYEFKAQRIFTVEQLAAISDGNAGNLPLGWRDCRDKAQLWLKSADESAPLLALKAENEKLRSDLRALETLFESHAKERSGNKAKTHNTAKE